MTYIAWKIDSTWIKIGFIYIIKKIKCPAEIEKTLIKYDQIKATIERDQNDKANQYDLAEKDMFSIAELLIKLNTPIDMDIEAKYQVIVDEPQIETRVDESFLRAELTTYRLKKSR